jgi:hypothetical protein
VSPFRRAPAWNADTCAKEKFWQHVPAMSADKPESESWSSKRRLIANIALVAVWVYVAMIYLLAFDQQFHWGIFPP